MYMYIYIYIHIFRKIVNCILQVASCTVFCCSEWSCLRYVLNCNKSTSFCRYF